MFLILSTHPMADLSVLDPVEVFAVGVHPTDDGPREYTHQDLGRIVANFQRLSDPSTASPLILEPTCVLGHEEDEDENKFWANLSTGVPSCGRVTKLTKNGDKLFARIEDVPTDIQKALANKLYTKVSSEIYDNFEDQGQDYGMALRRVAFLGGEIPQVKNLSDILAHVKMSERKSKTTRVTFFSECPDKFCQEGPNKGKPGPCPGQGKGAKSDASGGKGRAEKQVADALAWHAKNVKSGAKEERQVADSIKWQAKQTGGNSKPKAPPKKEPWDISGKVLDAASGIANWAPEAVIGTASGIGMASALASGNPLLMGGALSANTANAARLATIGAIDPEIDFRGARDALVETLPSKDKVIPRGRTKPGSVTDKARRLYDASRLVASGRIDTKEKKEMVSKRITKELEGASDSQVRAIAQKMGIEVKGDPRFDVAMGILRAQHPGPLAQLRAGIRQRTGFSESQDFCEGCDEDCGQKQQSFFEGYGSMDRAQMLEALQAMGVDTSVIDDATPDAVLEAWLKSVGGGAEEAPAEETFEEDPVDPNLAPVDPNAVPPEEEQMFADEFPPEEMPAGAAEPMANPLEDPMAKMSCKKYSEKLARYVQKCVANAVKKEKISADRKETIRQFSERLKAEGKVVPSMLDGADGKPTLETVLSLVAGQPVRKFGEKKVDPLKVVMEFFENLPQIAKFSEHLKIHKADAVSNDRINDLLKHSSAGRQVLAQKK